jgi:hypothetical protein
MLGVFALSGTVNAQDDRNLPVVTGKHWVESTEREKKAFLIGMGTIIEIEQEVQSKNPSSEKTKSFIPTFVAGLSQYSITEIMNQIDSWYQAHPDQLNRPVIEVIWSELVIPKVESSQ